ncbi:L-asparagine oxygenase [Virgisporangium aliadipatigenens]|uniref:L-asparagine oxygenase n=1 Tax=Virgisporangium aliadipatigenens TaxID=741659 RepID=A0A8J3YHW9_9ACTN|nr:TauD/TfdA family dioxygenase [Virgisporangium aliadipatigenens]GIJ44256.1 L-asparagine oxygenase [Virgisporangium aliadipatigenens]
MHTLPAPVTVVDVPAEWSARIPRRTESPYRSDEEFEQLWHQAEALGQRLPDRVRTALKELRDRRLPDGTLLLRGFAFDDGSLGPTPDNWLTPVEEERGWIPETCLLAVASVLGEVFAFARQHRGRLIQNMVPVRADATTQKGTGSRVFLEWHNEDAFDEFRADFVALLCVRSDPSARTGVVCVDHLNLSDRHLAVLAQPRFVLGVDVASGGSGGAADGIVAPIIEHDPNGAVTIRVDTDQVWAVDGDAEAAEALRALMDAVPAAARYVGLQAGEVLIMDNRRTLHGRTAYEPRFDGTDRWLQRVSITTDLLRSSGRRRGSSRIVANAG